MTRQRLLLLDLDNTLIDRAALFRGWAVDFLERNGLDGREVGWLVEHDGDGLVAKDAFFDQVRARYGLGATTDSLKAEYYERYPDFTIAPSSATVATLAAVRERGWRLGIVTNGPPMQERVVDNAGLRSLVDTVCVSAVLGLRKPDPAIFVLAAERCGTRPEGNWMIGDSPGHDIAGSLAAGMHAGWIARGRAWTGAAEPPTLTVDDVPQAVAMLLAADDSE
jgi:putative hydrolase of the HAD superfamily